jgi:hypothetical protein
MIDMLSFYHYCLQIGWCSGPLICYRACDREITTGEQENPAQLLYFMASVMSNTKRSDKKVIGKEIAPFAFANVIVRMDHHPAHRMRVTNPSPAF